MVIDGFFPNQNLFAGFLVVPFCFLLSRLLFEKIIRNLWLKLVGLALFHLCGKFLLFQGRHAQHDVIRLCPYIALLHFK